MVHRWHTTTTLTRCVVVWCCGCCFEYPQQHILTKCVVVWCCGCCFEYPQQHILLKCVVVWCCGCCFEYPQFTPTSLCCCCVSPMMMWVLFRVPTVYTHITLTTHFVKMCCCGYSKQHPQHHTTTHLVKMCCCGYSKQVDPQHHTTTHFVKMCCCGYSKQHPQHHTTTHFVNVVVVCHLWTIVVSRILCIQITRPHLAFGRYSSLLTGTSLAV